MKDETTQSDYQRVVFHNDDTTKMEFVISILSDIFGKSTDEAQIITATIHDQGQADAGQYPSSVADTLLIAAQERIKDEQNCLLLITLEPASVRADQITTCAFCGESADADQLVRGNSAAICTQCLRAQTATLRSEQSAKQFYYACDAVNWHFAGIPQDQLVTTSRQFPGHMRADVQSAVDTMFSEPLRFFGIHEAHRYETLTFASLTRGGQHALTIAPANYLDVDIGETDAVQCLNNGLWLCQHGDLPYAVVLSSHREYGQETGTYLEIAVPTGEAGSAFVQESFRHLEEAVHSARSYRGKVLSFEGENDYRGRSSGIMVHRLPPVAREDVILPEPTLELLDRNIIQFVGKRDRLRELGQSTRKGILLYGPPGTGKTHTIRYLSSNLPDHTTLIITAAQMGLLAQYMSLARLLQPALVVIEDVDLIARAREDMGGPCEEALLNQLLNEMDGLKENSDIIFVLTTNRPEQLEEALAGRPGRIDQAIEVPSPDERGREKLVRLYGKELHLSDATTKDAAARTKGVSAAFIKELMRRAAQAAIERDGGLTVSSADVGLALDDMLFTGGQLNVRLLGGSGSDD